MLTGAGSAGSVRRGPCFCPLGIGMGLGGDSLHHAGCAPARGREVGVERLGCYPLQPGQPPWRAVYRPGRALLLHIRCATVDCGERSVRRSRGVPRAREGTPQILVHRCFLGRPLQIRVALADNGPVRQFTSDVRWPKGGKFGSERIGVRPQRLDAPL